jgi:hypothetical protein
VKGNVVLTLKDGSVIQADSLTIRTGDVETRPARVAVSGPGRMTRLPSIDQGVEPASATAVTTGTWESRDPSVAPAGKTLDLDVEVGPEQSFKLPIPFGKFEIKVRSRREQWDATQN